MMGVRFGGYHSYDDFNLILSSKSISSPSPKKESIDIPGADSELDFTEFFGDVKFENRQLKFEFRSTAPYLEQIAMDSYLKNSLHGKKVKIILDADPDFYWVGRLSVGDWSDDKHIGKVTVTADCEPWKYALLATVVSVETSSAETTVLLHNLRRTVVPKITTSAPITVSWENGTVDLEAGTWMIPELVLREGATAVTVSGAANVKFEYREASL